MASSARGSPVLPAQPFAAAGRAARRYRDPGEEPVTDHSSPERDTPGVIPPAGADQEQRRPKG
jgi:hypothetical protein